MAIAIPTIPSGNQHVQAQTSKNNIKPNMENKMTVEQNKQVVFKFNDEFFGKGNTDITKEVFAEKFVNHSAPSNARANAGPMAKFVTDFHHGFSDISVGIQEILGEGDKACVRKTITATTQMNSSESNRRVKIAMHIMDIAVLKDGKITDRWNLSDFPQILQSL